MLPYEASRRYNIALALLVLLPVLMQLPALTGWRNPDPLVFTADIGARFAWPGGTPWIDPNVGFQAQALGRLSADQWLSGKVPWWNDFVGAGVPLAAEAQPGSLFLPFVLLYHFRLGWVVTRLLLQIIGGMCCFAFLRRLKLTGLAALTASLLFEFNGTFAWHGPPITTPIAFLPMLLLGVEQLRARVSRHRNGGWALIPVALAGSIYAGFPETAYIDGLFTGFWVLARLGGLDWRQSSRFIGKLSFAVVIGIACSLPLLVPFAEMLRLSFIGAHSNALAHAMLPWAAMAVSLIPRLFGPIFLYNDPTNTISTVWSSIGGYLPALQLAVLLLGLQFGPRRLTIMLGLWLFACLAKTFDLRPISDFINLIPMVGSSAFLRYCPPSWEFAGIVLVAMAIDGIQRSASIGRARIIPSFSASFAFACAALFIAKTPLAGLRLAAHYQHYFWHAIGWMVVSLAGGLFFALQRGSRDMGRYCVLGLSCLLVTDACFAFAMPITSGARKIHMTGSGVAFLRNHLGLERIYSLGPIAPNYGGYFKIAQIDHNYLPIPNEWVDYIHQNLDPGADGIIFNGGFGETGSDPSAAEELRGRLAAYEELAVKYVVTNPGDSPFLSSFAMPFAPSDALQPYSLPNDHTITVHWNIPVPAQPRWLEQINILIGNFANRANGILTANVCTAATICARGSADIASSLDNSPIIVPLDHPLALQAAAGQTGIRLSIAITQTGSNYPVALWLHQLTQDAQKSFSVDNSPPGFTPVINLRFTTIDDTVSASLPVYTGPDMTIHELPNAKPYFETISGHCAITPLSRTSLIADCSTASQLLRREAFYPGWRASIDGANVQVSKADGLFQTINLATGRHSIRFSYRPTHFRLIMLGFLLGLSVLIAGLCQEILFRKSIGHGDHGEEALSDSHR